MNMRQDIQYSWSCKDQSKKDVNIFEGEVKAECQYVVFSINSAIGRPIKGICQILLVEGYW